MKFLFLMLITFGDTLHLTMDRAVEIALNNNPELQSSRQQVLNGKLNLWESTLSYAVTPTFSYSKVDTTPSTQSLRLNFTLFSTNRINMILNNITASKSYRYSFDKTRNATIMNVKVSYLTVLSAYKTYQARRKQLVRARENLRFVEKQFELGSASKLDYLSAQVQVGQARINLLQAENQYKNSLNDLAEVLGLPPNTPIVCEDVKFDLDSIPPSPDSLIQQAIENRPDLRVARASVTAAKTSLWLNTLSFLPEVTYNMDWNKTDGTSWSKTGPKRYISLQVNLLSYPFNVLNGASSLKKSRFEYRAVYLQIANEVVSRYNDLRAAHDNYNLARTVFEQAQAAYELAKAKHQNGEIGMIELLKAESDLADAEASLSSALYGLYIAWVRLNYAVGKI